MTSKPHRLSACHRHPTTIPVTGFCAFCLHDRLAGIQSPSSSSSPHHHHHHHSPSPPSLRRTKSFSASAAATAVSEPRRRSCEVRSRNMLSELFTVDDQSKKNQPNRNPQLESKNSGLETREEEDIVEDVRVCDGMNDEEAEEKTKTMKEFIDMELRNRKNAAARDSRSFWEAASTFTEKLKKWRWKNKSKKRRSFGGNGNGNGNGDAEKNQRGWRLRETQSEVGEYGFGRRSCDTDPRFSIDPGRISVDNSFSRISCDPYSIEMGRVSVDNDLRLSVDTYSRLYVDDGQISVDNDSRVTLLDEPRASWDGCLMGKQCHRLPPMVPVEEDSNVGPNSCRRFDRSSSRRRQSMAEVDESRVTSNAKVSPATSELFYGAKLLNGEKDLALRNENVKPSRDVQGDCEMKGSASNVTHKGFKKFHKWHGAWNKLNSAVHRNEEVKSKKGSESVSEKLIGSYSVSCRTRNPCRMAGLISSLGSTETKKGYVLNGRQEFMLQRNRSVRYSPSNVDNGLLRFYLTPLRSHRRSNSGKSSLKDFKPIARSLF